ncbi:Uncharacterised protein [uncultured archaeon]|nr:Uncharacterised protein [uncultured archaeon]
MISYTRQDDGTFLKQGEFAAVPAEVLIQIGDSKPFSGNYTLAQATQIIEDAIKKNQVKKDLYRILPVPEKLSKAKTPKAPKEPKAPKAPKEKKPPKYDVQQFAQIYQNTKSLDDVVKATGASRAYAHRALVKLGLYEKPAAKVVAPVVLSEADEARVQEIIQVQLSADGGVANRKAAIKQLRKEQRTAEREAKRANEPKKERVFKYSVQQFREIYEATGGDVNQIMLTTGASKVYIIRALTKLGVYQKPVKVQPATEPTAPAPEPTTVPVSEPSPAPAATEPTPAPEAATPKAKRSHKKKGS